MLFRELRSFGNSVNQIAQAVNVAVQSSVYPPHQGAVTREALDLLRYEIRRVVAEMSGNFDYSGLPDEEKPTADPGAVERADVAAGLADTERKRAIMRPSKRFSDQG